MADNPKQVATTLAHKVKLLAKASVWGTWYSSAAFLIILIMNAIYDEQMLDTLRITPQATLFFFAGLEIMWLIGLMSIGLPLWMLAEKLGFTKRIHARLLGTLAALAVGIVLELQFEYAQPWKWMIPLSLAYIGNAIGKSIWKRSYDITEQ